MLRAPHSRGGKNPAPKSALELAERARSFPETRRPSAASEPTALSLGGTSLVLFLRNADSTQARGAAGAQAQSLSASVSWT